MITSDDEGPRHESDDPLATLLRPEPLYLSPPPDCYEAIHRGATRRRLVSAAATTGAALAVVAAIAVLVAAPLHGNGPGDPHPSSPVIPVAPPSGGTTRDTETSEPEQYPSVTPQPDDLPGTPEERPSDSESTALADPSHTPTPEDESVTPGPTEEDVSQPPDPARE